MRTNKQLLFELSGEHPELPLAELKAVLLSININQLNEKVANYKLKIDDRICTIPITQYSNKIVETLRNRLAMCHSINELLLDWHRNETGLVIEKIKKDTLNLSSRLKELEPESSFKLITKHLGPQNDSKNVNLKKISDLIINELSKIAKVNVSTPDLEIILFITKNGYYITKKLCDIDRGSFETRRPQHRPYFAPISLHPKLARALINLATVNFKDNESILDPFCGTGGLLIEAGLMGYNVIGSDIDKNMIMGSKKNLEHMGIRNFRLFQAEIGDLPTKLTQDNKTPLSAIITEPPYGRATTTQGETIESLIARAFKIFYNLLLPGNKLVISLPSQNLISIGQEYFELQNHYEIRIHRSLTKHICIYSRKT